MRLTRMPTTPRAYWQLSFDAPEHSIDSLMAQLIDKYMPELLNFSSANSPGFASDGITFNYIHAPVKPRIDAAIKDYMEHLPPTLEPRLRFLLEHTYNPYGHNYIQKTGINCTLYNIHDQATNHLAKVKVIIPLALMLTLIWLAVKDETKEGVLEGSSGQAQKIPLIERFQWINQLYFAGDDCFERPSYPLLQLLDGFQGKQLNMADKSQPFDGNAFLDLAYQQQMDILENIYNATWQPDDPESWSSIFVAYWLAAESTPVEIIQAKLFSILATLHYRANTSDNNIFTQVLDQIHQAILRHDTKISRLIDGLAKKSLFPEHCSQVVEYIAKSPRMPAEAIAWLLSKENGFDVRAACGPRDLHTPLSLACGHGHLALVRHLLEIDDSDEAAEHRLSAIKFAAYHRDVTILNLLLDNPPHIQTSDDYAQQLSLACEGALSETAKRGHLDVIRRLLQAIPQLTYHGWAYYDGRHYGPFLCWAAVHGHTEIIQILLAKGANMHDRESSRACLTSLSLAAMHGQVHSLRFMLNYARAHEQMPDVNYCKVLVLDAISHKQPAIVSLLLEQGLVLLSQQSAQAAGNVTYPGSLVPPRPIYQDARGQAGLAPRHDAIVQLAPKFYQPIVRALIEYILERDSVEGKRFSDYLPESVVEHCPGYPKHIKLRAAHKMIAALLSGAPEASLNNLSAEESAAAQEGELGKSYQAYQRVRGAKTTYFSGMQPLFREDVDKTNTIIPAPVAGPSVPGSSR